MNRTAKQIAGSIDHTLLKGEATLGEIDRLIDEAIEHGFASVCINPYYVEHAAGRLRKQAPKVCTVIAFPLGATVGSIKATQAVAALEHGADELDVVGFLPALMEADEDAVFGELDEIAQAARYVKRDVVIKVIVESALLLKDATAEAAESRIATACRAIRRAGCDFIKTSTGFHAAGGASMQAVRLMAKHADGIAVKASGGIKTLADAAAYLDAGATRLGCSASVAIVTGAQGGAGY